MNFLNLFGCGAAAAELKKFNAVLAAILVKLETLMTTTAEAAEAIVAISAQLTKVKDEIVGKVAELESQLTAAGTVPLTDAQAAALATLTDTVNQLDAIVPDAPAPEPAPVDQPV